MKITFPFAIVQCDENAVEIDSHPMGDPMLRLDLHDSIRDISEATYTEAVDRAFEVVLRALVKIER